MGDDEGWETAGPGKKGKGRRSSDDQQSQRGARGGGNSSARGGGNSSARGGGNSSARGGGNSYSRGEPTAGPSRGQGYNDNFQSYRGSREGGGGGAGGGGYNQRGGGSSAGRGYEGFPRNANSNRVLRRSQVDYRQRNKQESVQVSLTNKSLGNWLKIHQDGMEKITLPARPQAPATIGKAGNSVAVNYFKTDVKLPAKIRHYEINITRLNSKSEPAKAAEKTQYPKKEEEEETVKSNANKFTLDVRVAIANWLTSMIEKDFKRKTNGELGIAGVITDFVDAMYSCEEIEKYCSMSYFVAGRELGDEADSTLTYHVEVKATKESIDTEEFVKIINDMKGRRVPQGLVDLERVYNILVRCFNTDKFMPIGRSSLVAFDDKNKTSLGKGLVSYSGYNVNQGLGGGWKPYLNVEVANVACIPYTSVLEFFKEIVNSRGGFNALDITTWKPQEFHEISRRSKGIKISYCRGRGAKGEVLVMNAIVAEVLNRSVSQESFDWGDGKQKKKMTIREYAQREYKNRDGSRLELKPHGPCLKFTGDRNRIVPAEICKIVKGQSFNRRLEEAQTSKMIDLARLYPHVLHKKILNVRNDLNLEKNALAEKYGVSVSSEMLTLEPRILPPPELLYGHGAKGLERQKHAMVLPKNGVWDIWNADFEFFSPIKVDKWGVLILASGVDQKTFDDWERGFVRKAEDKGMGLPKGGNLFKRTLFGLQDLHSERERNLCELEKVLGGLYKQGCKFVLVVIPKKNGPIYAQVKQVAELRVGIVTQCVTAASINAPSGRIQSIMGNIVLKLNSKLNGINHVVQEPFIDTTRHFDLFEKQAVMVLGADVTHPSTTSGQHPSIAAVTASYGREGMKFMTSIQAQAKAGKNAAEIIVDLTEIVAEFIKQYIATTQTAPTKIIYYRDGVGSGQFTEILHKEMSAIRNACRKAEAWIKGENKYEPEITVITVQKRNKTRVFSDDGTQYRNADAGTVIDQEITHPYENDFFMIPHAGILGTSRPTRFHVLWDDSNFTNNQLQLMTYYLCYMYIRCNRAVRIPAPTYYAHWAAARAKILCEGADPDVFSDLNQLNGMLQRKEEFIDLYPMHFI